ncbi:hypothetical protein IVB33_22680 [Bradyrhizobium sp. 24]|uniref:hypothetical protein n=1 Tax=unclassified Bradyrhizobium TaxID=2631580 RepID=UPI001FFAA974|nr:MULTISPECIES: hypothetical protein [unclassified Bradyrhizobium]MCK1380108.1 hypothetical protein [Bradyrhizobium sp. 24]MCK1296729.1 hypothetical protein [Bradyrhizobium sp. 37]MCK1315989.1 hypothetical protein [Bradyrhizobium sp. 23]MCK1397626.1 hypothetical protein [Bradyrhizobium sp. 39]MCK1749179.1 hypothetical protein [Bradyrhizobium sp. 135]
MHIENSQTEAMARELTVVEKGPPHPNSASARAHELEIEPTSFFLDRGVQFCPDLRHRGQLLGGQPTKRFRDGPYDEIHRRIALHRAHQRLRRGTRAFGSPAGNRNASDVAAGPGEGGCRGSTNLSVSATAEALED